MNCGYFDWLLCDVYVYLVNGGKKPENPTIIFANRF